VTHDGGKTWSTPTMISGDLPYNQGSVPTVAADGSIYVAFLSYDPTDPEVDANGFRDHYMVVKLNPQTGAPVGAPVDVGRVYDGIYDYPFSIDGRPTYQDSQFRTWSAGNMTADPTNAKHLAVVWTDMRNNPYDGAFLPHPDGGFADPYAVHTNSDVIVSQSFDGGVTWSSPAALAIANDQFYAWGAFDKNGNLQIGFHDRSYDPANHKYGYTLATVSGLSTDVWAVSTQQLTTALSDPTTGDRWNPVTVNPNFPDATRFMGDYSAIAVTPTGVVAYWTDMRNDATFLGVTGHGQECYFASTSSLPGFNAGGVAPDSFLIDVNTPPPGFSAAGVAPSYFLIDFDMDTPLGQKKKL
jgi:hypothetical protein